MFNLNYKVMIKIGDTVECYIDKFYTGKVIDIDVKYQKTIYVLDCEHWCYENQITGHFVSDEENEMRIKKAWERVKQYSHPIKNVLTDFLN